jgi:hypothetical protein
MMNSYERVKAALNFEHPDRVPVFKVGLGDLLPCILMPSTKWQPGHAENEKGLFPHLQDDMLVKFGLYRWKKPDWAKDPKYSGKKWLELPREEIDEWGCIWNRDGRNTNMGHPGRASLLDWKNLDIYLEQYTPNLDEPSRYRLFKILFKLAGRNRYRSCGLGHMGPSQTASMIRGFSQYLVDHRKHPNELRQLLAHLTEFYITGIKMYIKYGFKPHGFWIVDDLGEQSGPFFGPRLFEEFYRPVYKSIIDEAHNRGCEVHLHCCGKVDKLLPLFIDWGLDGIEFDSPRMSGYQDLAPYRGKIMYWGCVNIQSIYTQGTPSECEREVWHMVRNLGTPEGGFGAYFYPQAHHIRVSKSNVNSFKSGLKKYGVYSKIPKVWWDAPLPSEWRANVVPPLPKIDL